MEEVVIRKAVTGDVEGIRTLVNGFAAQGMMLGLSLAEIYDQIRDFNVAVEGSGVVGTCALRVAWDDLAEVRSLAVRDDRQNRGLGRGLVQAALSDARRLGIRRVFALTYQADFFARIGFRRVDKSTLPHKIWNDCLKCVKFPHCDEEAFMIEVEG